MSSPLVSVEWLHPHLGDPQLRIVDCRFSLQDPLAGRLAFREGHIPGAIFLDLEQDLCGPIRPDRKGGRHPLPAPEALAETLGRAGIGNEHLVVAYDEPPAGGMYAPHLWWLLRWLGHDRVAVLDGGITAWREAGYEVSTLVVEYPPTTFRANLRPELAGQPGRLGTFQTGSGPARAFRRTRGRDDCVLRLGCLGNGERTGARAHR
jgi:thiosulfate/3-mercaptopyruvate sulfurtransferase